MKYKYLNFRFIGNSRSGKTDIYEVTNHECKIGEIRWYSVWRQYCFFPCECTLYNKGCLRDIANFMEIHGKGVVNIKKRR